MDKGLALDFKGLKVAYEMFHKLLLKKFLKFLLQLLQIYRKTRVCVCVCLFAVINNPYPYPQHTCLV